jgi:hypothetical protein
MLFPPLCVLVLRRTPAVSGSSHGSPSDLLAGWSNTGSTPEQPAGIFPQAFPKRKRICHFRSGSPIHPGIAFVGAGQESIDSIVFCPQSLLDSSHFCRRRDDFHTTTLLPTWQKGRFLIQAHLMQIPDSAHHIIEKIENETDGDHQTERCPNTSFDRQ